LWAVQCPGGKSKPAGVDHQAGTDEERYESGAGSKQGEHVVAPSVGVSANKKKYQEQGEPDGGADNAVPNLPHSTLFRRLEKFFDFGQNILNYVPEVAVFLDLSYSVGDGAADFLSGTGGRGGDGVRSLEGGPDNVQLGSTRAAKLALIAVFGGAIRTKHEAPLTQTV